MFWVLTFNHAVDLEAVLWKSPLLVFGISDPIRRILCAFTALQNFAVDFEPNEQSTSVFTYCNHSAHAPILRRDWTALGVGGARRKTDQSFRAARFTPAFGREESPSARILLGAAEAVPFPFLVAFEPLL